MPYLITILVILLPVLAFGAPALAAHKAKPKSGLRMFDKDYKGLFR